MMYDVESGLGIWQFSLLSLLLLLVLLLLLLLLSASAVGSIVIRPSSHTHTHPHTDILTIFEQNAPLCIDGQLQQTNS